MGSISIRTAGLTITLGRSRAVEGEPDGFTTSLIDKMSTDEAVWAQLEERRATQFTQAILKMLAPAIGVDPARVTFDYRYAFDRGRWRPALVFSFPDPDRLPTAKEADAAASMIGLIGGRDWVMWAGDTSGGAASNTVASEPARPPETTTFREQLREDFGVDVAIGPGGGNSIGDPIIVEAGPAEFHHAVHTTTRCIEAARGYWWAPVAPEVVEHEGQFVLRYKFERAVRAHAEWSLFDVNRYFLSPGASRSDLESWIAVPAHVDRGTRLPLPRSLGWLHFDNIVDNEASDPRFGTSYLYSTRGIKLTLFVYTHGMPPAAFSDPSTIEAEFNATQQGLHMMVRPDDSVGKMRAFGHVLRADFRARDDLTSLSLSDHRGHFVKARLTWQDEPEVTKMAEASLTALWTLVDGERRRAPERVSLLQRVFRRSSG